jgi:cysteinyl-tRNA synthetase
LEDDFNSAGAIGKIFEAVRLGNAYITEGAASPHQGAVLVRMAAAVRDLLSQLGVVLAVAGENRHEPPADVLELVRLREEARRGRDWAAADGYRDRIREKGFVVEDRPDGPLLKIAD